MSTLADSTNRPRLIIKRPGAIIQLYIILFSILPGAVGAISIGGKTPNVFWVDITIACFGIYMLLSWSQAKRSRPMRFPRMLLWAMVYVAVAAASIPVAADKNYSIAVLKLRIMPLVVFMIAYHIMRGRQWSTHLMNALVIFGGCLALMTLRNWSLYRSGALVLQQGLGGKDMAQVSWAISNTLAGIFALLIPLAFSTITVNRRSMLAVNLVCLGAMMTAIAATMSRGGIASLGLGMVVWMMMSLSIRWSLSGPKIRGLKAFSKGILVLAGVICLVTALLPRSLFDVLGSRYAVLGQIASTGMTSDDRVARWVVGLEHVRKHPIAGIGLGNQWSMRQRLGMVGSTHNLYLETLIESGLIGFVPMMGFLAGFGLMIYRWWKFAGDHGERMLAAGAMGALAAGLVNSFEEPLFWSAQYACIFWMLMAMSCAAVTSRGLSAHEARRQASEEGVDA